MSYSAFHLGGDERRTIKETFTQLRGWDPSRGAYGSTAFVNNHSLRPGDVVRHDGGPANQGASNETVGWVRALANNPENAEALGVVESVEGSTFTVVLQGRFRLDLMSDTLEYPKVYYLDREIPGKLVCHQPQGAGEVIKPMLLTTDVKNGYVVNYIGTVIGGDCTVDVTEISPVGQVLPFAGPTGQIPDGHLLCDGSKLITGGTWKDLFNVIGYTYGNSGDDWFHIPDLQGRFPLGANIAGSGTGLTTRNLGASGGSEISTLAAGNDFDGSGAANQDREITGDNMPPFTAINYIIRYRKDANAVVNCPSAGNAFTNKVINGGFDLWQRGTNFNATGGITGNQSYYTADRWVNQVYWDDNTNTEWQGGVNLGRFGDGQTAVPYYPQFYAKIQSFLTGQEGAVNSVAMNMEDPQSIDGQTIGIKDSSRFGRETNVVGGSIRTDQGVGIPASWKSGAGFSGKKPASLSWQNKYESDDAYCVGESHSATNLKEDYTAVAGPFDFAKKDPDFPKNGQEFTVEGWFKITGGMNALTGAVTGSSSGCTNAKGGHAPITLLRFGTPPATGCSYGSAEHLGFNPLTGSWFGVGCGDMITGIDGRWMSSLQFIASDDTGFGYAQGLTGSVTGPLYPVVQWNAATGGYGTITGATGATPFWNEVPLSITGTTNINDGNWHHIAFARNNTCNEFKLYIDGILQKTHAASGNDIQSLAYGGTGNTGGGAGSANEGEFGDGGSCYRHGDMYVFGALDLDNACTTGNYCADLIKVHEGIDTTTHGYYDATKPVTGPCSYNLTGHQGFTGGIPGYPYRNTASDDEDSGGEGSFHNGFCAFSHRIEGVRTFAESQDEYVTLTFWAKGPLGSQANGDIHINIKQCFGTDIPLATGFGDEVYGNTARAAGSGSKFTTTTQYSIVASKKGSGAAVGGVGEKPNLEFDATLISSTNVSKPGTKTNQQDCQYCTDDCFNCGDTIPSRCHGCRCCSSCQDFTGDCSQCPPGVDCSASVCPLGYCCVSQGECTITTCEDCLGAWTDCGDPEGKCFGKTSCPQGQCDWYQIPSGAAFTETVVAPETYVLRPGTLENEDAGGKTGAISFGENPDAGDGDPQPTDPEGACCGLCSASFNGCVVATASRCTAFGGTYQGDDTVCGGCASEPTCCVSYGVCCGDNTLANPLQAHYAYRIGNTGTPYIGTSCLSGSDNPCNGTYLHYSFDNPHPNINSVFNHCLTGATGACCSTAGACADNKLGPCATASGAFQGWGVTCGTAGVDCTTGGACCHWDGRCLPMSNTTHCSSVSGTWHGTGTVCGSVTCTGHGACCNEADGECYEVVSGECGTNYLTGEHCYDVVCSRGDTGLTGACCVDGEGSVITEIECDNLGGKWYGTGTASDNTACCRVLPGVRFSLYPTWKKYEITFRLPHIANMKVGDRGNDFVEINFFSYADVKAGIENKLVGYGSDTIPTNLPCNYAEEWNLAQVQLERGQKASRWEHRPVGVEKRMCERYYEVRRDFSFTTFKHLTGNENHGDTSAPPTGGTFHSREFIPYEVEKLYERPEVFVFGVEESTYRLTGFSVIERNADGFTFKSNYNTGSNAGLAHLTGNYAVISELYTPEEERQLGYDFYQNEEGA